MFAPVMVISLWSVADGTAPEDPFLGTEDIHVADPGHEDPPVESNDVDHMEEDLLNEIYEKAADVSIWQAIYRHSFRLLYSCLNIGYAL